MKRSILSGMNINNTLLLILNIKINPFRNPYRQILSYKKIKMHVYVCLACKNHPLIMDFLILQVTLLLQT